MGKKKVEKRKFIEGIFNLEVFGKMLSQLRQNYNDVKRDFDVEVARHEEVESTLKSYKNQKDKFIVDRQARLEKLIKRQKDNKLERTQLQDKLFDSNSDDLESIKVTIESKEQLLEAVSEKINEKGSSNSTHKTTIKFNKQSHDKIGTTKDNCPVCLKPISSHDRQHIHDEKDTIMAEISNIETEIVSNNQALDKLSEAKDQLKSAIVSQNALYNEHILKIKDNDNNKDRIKQLDGWLEQLGQDLKNFQAETDEFDDSIKKTKQRYDTIQKEIDNIKHKLSILDVVKFIVSEEGVKSYIVRKILQLFNSKILYYLKKMDANCWCGFNEYFEEEIVDEKGKICSYFNFSGAERKNIDLACLFAFMDIRRLQGNVAYNFSIYDELLDSSLDERGVDLVLDILRERVEKYNECVMIISHRKESVNIGSHYKNPGEVIYLEKENGITRRVDFVQ